jgi:hypothetical protein
MVKARVAAIDRQPAPKLSGKLLVWVKELWVDPKLTATQVERLTQNELSDFSHL